MNATALRNDAERMLRFVASDMEAAQSEDQRAAKGLGHHTVVGSAAHDHGGLRHMQAFDLIQMVSEFRALRASVIRLYSAEPGTVLPAKSSELIRFNESIDQILAESVHRYAGEMERARELLLAVLGHDLRSPLSSIRMSAAILAKTPLTPRQTDLTAGIIRGSERMARMVQDLLDFTRTRLGAKLVVDSARCDLDAVCRTIAAEVRSGHPDREVTVETSGNCVGQWDCERMGQLVSNLVGNAVRHGYPSTPVKITTASDDADWVTLLVENQGPAIPVDGRSSIFDAWNRPREEIQAQMGRLGLGLYIVKEIASAHGGSVKLVSSAESGTLFEVRLPRVTPKP